MQQNTTSMGVIPVLSSQAGHCMTSANWQDVGVGSAVYYLDSLLVKPGFDFLRTLPNLATYVAWSRILIINASMSVDNQGGYSLRSPYDGSRSYYSLGDILTLIARLSPHYVIMPPGASKGEWQSLPESIFPFFPLSDIPDKAVSRSYGIYLSYEENDTTFSEFVKRVEHYQSFPRYVAGDFTFAMLKELTIMGVDSIESDKPAFDAYHGCVYSQKSTIQIQDTSQAMLFETIDSTCKCPTCQQQFTKAYLHHLFEHTPLLCQRLLIQHNQYVVSQESEISF